MSINNGLMMQGLIQQEEGTMNVSDFMTSDPVTIGQNKNIYEAMSLMEQIGCHHLPVMSEQGHLIGILSSHDCHVALNLPYGSRHEWHDQKTAHQILVRAMMTPAPIIVEASTPAAEAARLMMVNQVSCLPVMRGETLIGILTTSDVLMAFMRCQRSQLEQQKK